MWDTPERRLLGVPLEGEPGLPYDEKVFRYFLAVERARADRSNRPLRLVLVSLNVGAGQSVLIPPVVAAKVFEGLRLSVRETDFVGWHREDRVAGAVLSERTDTPGTEASRAILQRVTQVLQQRLPSNFARRLQVRVVQVRPRLKEKSKWPES